MLCRAPSSGTTCSGSPTGAQLTYDPAGQLSVWQNQPSNPSSSDQFLYDGEGTRVAQQITASGATTTTVYVGSLEEVSTTGSTTTTTYYSAMRGARSPHALARRIWQHRSTKLSLERRPALTATRSASVSGRTKIGGLMRTTIPQSRPPSVTQH